MILLTNLKCKKMKAYLVSGFSSNYEGIGIESAVFTTLEDAKRYVDECAEMTKAQILAEPEIYNNIYSDKIENVYKSGVYLFRTIELQINLDKESDKNFYKDYNLAEKQINSQIYAWLDLSDRRLTSIKLLDLKIMEIELNEN